MSLHPIFTASLFLAQFAMANESRIPLSDLRTLADAVEQPANEGRAFAISEVVVSVAPSNLSDIFAASDETGHLRVTDGQFHPDLRIHPGDRLMISGVIVRQDNGLYNYAKATNIVIRTHGDVPAPITVTTSEINSGEFLDRLVSTQGRIVDVFRDEIDPRFVFFVLADESDFIYASLFAEDQFSDEKQRLHLLDSVVLMTGLCSRSRPQGTGRQIDISLSLRLPDAISILTPPPEDPFSAPLFGGHIRDVQRISGRGTSRRKVRGTVIAVWNRRTALVRSEDDTLSTIDFVTTRLPSCGDFIEAVGLPETDLYTFNLSRAIWRPANGKIRPEPEVETVPISSLFTDRRGHSAIIQAFHGRLLRFSGKVNALPTIGNERLILEIDGHSIPVDFSSTPTILERVDVGCSLDITGICVMETQNWRPQLPFPQIKGIFLVIRSPNDVQILSAPPWWTPRRLVVVITVLLGAFLLLLMRNILLARLTHVRLEERTRLAVELHDTIAQNLTGASFEINAAERLVTNDGNTALRHLGRAARTLKSCRDELRNCIWDLRSRALDTSDMNTAIRCTLEPHVGDTALTIRFNAPRKVFSDDSAHALLRIIRELTLNAIRHGKAKSVKIAGSVERGTLRFSVRDDGIGFDPQNRPGLREGHFGLQGVHERIKKFNGRMQIESNRESGTRIMLTMTLPADSKIRL